jgi:site-specific DNA-methyltransferase (adenine-specific)
MVHILVGDCLKKLSELESNSVNCCVTSPPYFGLRDYGEADQIGLESTPDDFVDKLMDVFREVKRVLRDDGTLWINLGDSYAAQRGGTKMPAETLAGGAGGYAVNGKGHRGRGTDNKPNGMDSGTGRKAGTGHAHRNAAGIGLKHKDLIGIPWRVAFALQADGWYLRQDIIWHKPNPMPESVTDRCTKAHEYIFLLSKNERYFFDSEAIQEKATRAGKPRVFGARDQVGTMRNDIGRVFEDDGTRNKRSVWSVNVQPFRGAHFATFPPDLIMPCILAGCPEGGTVLDPFGGAGTTGLVANWHNRNAILCEINPSYAELAKKRIKDDDPIFSDVETLGNWGQING